MSDMPKEIWVVSTEKREQYIRLHCSTLNHDGEDYSSQYTLTAHHTAEIAKRDRAIEVLIEALNIAKRMIPRTYGEIKTSEPLQLLLKQVDSAEEKAQAILNGE